MTSSSSAPEGVLARLSASLHAMVGAVVARLPLLAVAAIVFVLFIGAAHLVRWLVRRATASRRKANIGIVLGRLSYFALILLGVLVAVTIVAPSMTPARLVSLLGIGGVAVGFAFKDLFQNMVAGILLLWREPFRIGDEITSKDFTGSVEAIETRATFIRTYDGKRIIIPNSLIYTEPVAVISAYDMIRSEYDVGIGYGDDVDKARAIFEEILTTTPGIFQDPPPEVLVWELAASTTNVRLRWWSKPDRPTVVKLRDAVLAQVRDRLPKAGIDLPYPTRVVLFHDQTEETDGDRTRQREGWPAGDDAPKPARIGSAIRARVNGDVRTTPRDRAAPSSDGARR